MSRLSRYPAVSAALLALLVVIGLALVTIRSELHEPVAAVEPLPASLGDFRFVLGDGQLLHGVLEVNQYTGGRAIISNKQGLADSGNYRYLRFDLNPARPNEDLPSFFWRSADSGQLHTVPLEDNILDHLDLGRHKQWHGRISEFGFIFQGSDDQAWRLRDAAFHPDSMLQSFTSILSDWLEIEVWSQHSAHFINGGAANSRWSLGILVAGWVFLSLLLYWLLSVMAGQQPDGKWVAAILLMGWMLLDVRWLYNLLQQVQITREVYAGKTLDQQYGAGMDGDYYAYTQRLLDQVLPEEPQFLYVLDNDTDYYRVKLPWLLAPHNLFNLDRYPRPEYAAKGGYVLVLDKIPGLWFDWLAGALRWDRNQMLPVQPVDQDPLGLLYRIRPPGGVDKR